MKNNTISFWFSLIALVGVAALFSMQLSHKDKVAYVDNLKLIEKYKGMDEARKLIEKNTQQLKNNVDTLASEFEQSMKNYEQQRAKGMSEKEMRLNEELLQNKQKQFMQYRDASQKKIKEEENKITGEVLSKLNNIIKEYGKKQNYKIIFGANTSGNIVYADNVLDITDEVIEVVNEASPKEREK